MYGFCRYPGSPECYNLLFDAVDTDVISECAVRYC